MEEIQKVNSLQEVAALTSLGMTLPTVILAIGVIYMWFPSARDAWVAQPKKAHDWFIIGVVAGFTGALLDNIYWFLPWTASFLDHPAFTTLTNLGVFFNIFFRQGLGICAAYCHLKAAELSDKSPLKFVNKLLCISNMLGVVYVLYLVVTKYKWTQIQYYLIQN
jgi:hypothetical protein